MCNTAILTNLALGMPEHIVRKISGHAANSKSSFATLKWRRMSLIKRLIKCLSRLGIMGRDKICVNRNRSISNYFCCYISFEQNNRSLLYRIKIKTVKNLKFFNYTTILGLWKLFLNVSVFWEAYPFYSFYYICTNVKFHRKMRKLLSIKIFCKDI